MPATVKLWTVQMGKWRLAKERGIPVLDITVKGGSEFGPDWHFLMDYKKDLITEAEYTDLYIEKMRDSLRQRPQQWEQLKKRPEVAFACYCKPGKFCHRHLFTELATKYLKSYGYEVELKGEIT